MADYRDWCGSCNREINFGSHDPDCDWLHAQNIACKEQRDFEEAIHKEYAEKSDDELLAEATELYQDIRALSSMLHAKEKKWDFMYRDVLMYDRRKVLEKMKDRLGLRYL